MFVYRRPLLSTQIYRFVLLQSTMFTFNADQKVAFLVFSRLAIYIYLYYQLCIPVLKCGFTLSLLNSVLRWLYFVTSN